MISILALVPAAMGQRKAKIQETVDITVAEIGVVFNGWDEDAGWGSDYSVSGNLGDYSLLSAAWFGSTDTQFLIELTSLDSTIESDTVAWVRVEMDDDETKYFENSEITYIPGEGGHTSYVGFNTGADGETWGGDNGVVRRITVALNYAGNG